MFLSCSRSIFFLRAAPLRVYPHLCRLGVEPLGGFPTRTPFAGRPALRAFKSDLVKEYPKDYQDDIARAIELADRASSDWCTTHTHFITPPVQMHIRSVIERLAAVACVPWGGYPQAERCRMIIAREEMIDGFESAPETIGEVVAVKVQGNFIFDTAEHGDFLGAALGTGIKRDVLGDIILQGDKGAVLFTTEEVASHLESALTRVRTVPVETRIVPLSELNIPPPRVKELRTTEASMRLDAVASAGFGCSREKMAKMIKAGDVKVNWAVDMKPTRTVKEEDVISCAGRGRMEVKSVGQTKKGRYALELIRYM
ncbi:hypothetical protein BSKO_01855 [Bryopsis sp. KO-2023]|nr:hypothetical protein BSKO_01855 [Bryopsis sp. KO-2023]